jgi:hypothetical protein
MDRDDFSKQIQDALAMRVGVRCSNPSCRKLTTGPRAQSSFIVNIGVAAHITAASSGGPRYDSGLSPQQRKSPENGIWLCQSCAKLIDNDPILYPAEVLLEWRGHAEECARAELEGKVAPEPADLSAELDLSYRLETNTGDRHDYRLDVTLANRGTKPLDSYHIDLIMPALVVSKPRSQPGYLPENSNYDMAFFRVSSGDGEQRIYPGDSGVVISVRYHVDRDIFWGVLRGNLSIPSFDVICDRPVKVTLYHYGFKPLTLERRFREFQVF